MFRRISCYTTIVLAATYVAPSLFLGVTHHHLPVAPNHHTGHAHECGHEGRETVGLESFGSPAENHSHHSHDDPARGCLICRYLALPSLPASVPIELAVDHVEPLVVHASPSFVSLPQFSLPRPRSPPEVV